MRPLRIKTKVLIDEYMTESLLKIEQEKKLYNLIFLIIEIKKLIRKYYFIIYTKYMFKIKLQFITIIKIKKEKIKTTVP